MTQTKAPLKIPVRFSQEALDDVSRKMPDVVLLEIGMPGMSGLTVASRLRAMYGAQAPAIVALTA